MGDKYFSVLQTVSLPTLLTLPHKHTGTSPTGFVVRTNETVSSFPFTVCSLQFVKANEEPMGTNPNDVIVDYSAKDGDLETLLYNLYELYREKHLESTGNSQKRYKYKNTLPPRKIIIPCLGRKENLIPTLKRLQTIDPPIEGYRPQICIVEHSPFPDLEMIATEYKCEYLWIFLDPRDNTLPVGQFNKALCYDKAFLFGSPAEWYLFHDNDVLVPRDFWNRLDKNVERAKTKFIQPYTHRSLLNTVPEIAQRLRENVDLADQGLTEEMIFPIVAGAPGGSLYLHRERYLEVGGHDPNYFWGYGPEDKLFFEKVKLIEPIAYADDPPIEMIHLWHETAAVQNPFRFQMDWFVHIFLYTKPPSEKKEMMKNKRLLLEDILQDIENQGYNRSLH